MSTPDKSFSIWKVILPVIIGLVVVILMFVNDAREEGVAEIISSIDFTARTVLFIMLAWVFMAGRDFGLCLRFRELTDRQLHWTQALKVAFMCEFTSCITPSSVGGSSLGMFYLNGEGIEIGRATALMLTTLLLDEMFFVLACPVFVSLTPASEMFASAGHTFTQGIRLTFWLVYSGIVIWTLILFVGLLLKPHAIASLLKKIFSIRFLRRWQHKVIELGNDMVATSHGLRKKPFSFWLRTFGATAMSWTSRFLVVNALFLAFVPTDLFDQWIILVRQFVVWVVLTVSPTPGGSGLSEWLFTEYYGNLIPTAGLALVIAVFWRIISYYVYLIVGVCIMPGWVKKSIDRLKNNSNHKTIHKNEN